MRWQTPPAEPQYTPEHPRVRWVFAWLPVDCDDGMTRWLEWVEVRDYWQPYWDDGDWETISVRPRAVVEREARLREVERAREIVNEHVRWMQREVRRLTPWTRERDETNEEVVT